MAHTANVFSITSQGLSSQDFTWIQGCECLWLLICRNQQHCSWRKGNCSSLVLPVARAVPGCPVLGTWQRHSPGELKIDLGHPFATGARIAQGLPVGEAALIKRTIFKEPGCREEEVIISWWQWLHCRTGLGWVPALTERSAQPEKTQLGSRKD